MTGDTEFDFVWASGKIALYELSAEETALDASVLGQKYHYVSDTKSTNSVRVKNVGKNIISLDINDWEEGTFDSSPGKNGEEVTYGANRIRTKEFTPVFPNTQYSISLVNSAYEIWVLEFDTNKTTRTDGTGYTYYQANTFITKNNTGYLRLCIRKDGVMYTDNTPASAVYASDINNIKPQLEVGPVATVYEPGGKESSIYINTGGEPLRSVGSVKDEVSVSDGKLTKRAEQVVFDNESVKDWSYVVDTGTGNHVLYKQNWLIDNNSVYPLYMGAKNAIARDDLHNWIISSGITAIAQDAFGVAFHSSGNLYLIFSGECISNNYTPDKQGCINYLEDYPLTLTYQLAQPIITKLPAQPPLQVYENGTVYVEPLGDPSETTLPTVELTVPIARWQQSGNRNSRLCRSSSRLGIN